MRTRVDEVLSVPRRKQEATASKVKSGGCRVPSPGWHKLQLMTSLASVEYGRVRCGGGLSAYRVGRLLVGALKSAPAMRSLDRLLL
jgi:hypothetical protein